VVILGVLGGVGTAVLIVFIMERLDERAIERQIRMERQMRLLSTLAQLELGMCVIRGHKYQLVFHRPVIGRSEGMQVWRCGECGDERDGYGYDQRKGGAA